MQLGKSFTINRGFILSAELCPPIIINFIVSLTITMSIDEPPVGKWPSELQRVTYNECVTCEALIMQSWIRSVHARHLSLVTTRSLVLFSVIWSNSHLFSHKYDNGARLFVSESFSLFHETKQATRRRRHDVMTIRRSMAHMVSFSNLRTVTKDLNSTEC
jgi:hypothetical protein